MRRQANPISIYTRKWKAPLVTIGHESLEAYIGYLKSEGTVKLDGQHRVLRQGSLECPRGVSEPGRTTLDPRRSNVVGSYQYHRTPGPGTGQLDMSEMD